MLLEARGSQLATEKQVLRFVQDDHSLVAMTVRI